MNAPFILIEIITFIGVPSVIAICIRLILQDTYQQREQRREELHRLRAELESHFRKPVEDGQKIIGEMESFKRRLRPVRTAHQSLSQKWAPKPESGASEYGTVTGHVRSGVKILDLEWRQ